MKGRASVTPTPGRVSRTATLNSDVSHHDVAHHGSQPGTVRPAA